MAVFVATAAAENFTGTGGVIDTVRYNVNATAGVTVNTVAGGQAGIAAGDTYASIERFFLGDVAAETDRFFGSAANDFVNGLAGFNLLSGFEGDDTLIGGDDGNRFTGGSGADTALGGAGNDSFVLAAGDVSAGEIMRGFGGIDTILLTAGGTGDTIDLTGATIVDIEQLRFLGDVTLRADIDTLTLFGGIFGSEEGEGEVIEVTDWSTQAGNVEIDGAIGAIEDGIDEVRWQYGVDLGDVTLTGAFNELLGGMEYVETFVNDGPRDIALAAQVNYYDESAALFQTIETYDSGLEIFTLYEPGTDTVISTTVFDVSPSGTFRPWDFVFTEYEANGDMSYRLIQYDDDVDREEVYVGGELVFVTRTDGSGDGLAEVFETVEEVYENGVLTQRITDFDEGQPFQEEALFYSAPGVLDMRVLLNQNDVYVAIGSSADQTFVATEATEVARGRGGVDTFIFSGDVGRTTILDFDDNGADLLDLTAYGIDSRDALETAGALTYDAANTRFLIDVDAIGGSGTIVLSGMADAELGNDDFVLGIV